MGFPKMTADNGKYKVVYAKDKLGERFYVFFVDGNEVSRVDGKSWSMAHDFWKEMLANPYGGFDMRFVKFKDKIDAYEDGLRGGCSFKC